MRFTIDELSDCAYKPQWRTYDVSAAAFVRHPYSKWIRLFAKDDSTKNTNTKCFPYLRCNGKQKGAMNQRMNEGVYVGCWKILYNSRMNENKKSK